MRKLTDSKNFRIMSPCVDCLYTLACDVLVSFTGSFTGNLYVINRGYLFFSVKERNLFHRVNTIGIVFKSGAARSENITDGVYELK